MKSTTVIDEQSRKIEQMVSEHLAAMRVAFVAAVERAFGAAVPEEPRVRAPRMKSAREPWKRRTQQEVAELGERFCEVVAANPGETMMTLARKVGVSAQKLHLPMTLLKRAGRVRSVGERSKTRYFPALGRRAVG